jgi:quercetin dioxygenase-like cupin family protein
VSRGRSAPVLGRATESHPDPRGAPDLTPIEVGEVWENPITGERGTILELPYRNPEGRATVELTALVGARVVGEHRHPALIERFTVLEGELTLNLDGQTTVLHEGESGVIEPGVEGYVSPDTIHGPSSRSSTVRSRRELDAHPRPVIPASLWPWRQSARA